MDLIKFLNCCPLENEGRKMHVSGLSCAPHHTPCSPAMWCDGEMSKQRNLGRLRRNQTPLELKKKKRKEQRCRK